MDSRHLAHLKERLQPKVNQLDLRGTDLESFRAYLERARQRPVYLVPLPLGPEVLGLWAAADTFDCIFYEEHTTSYHQRHIVLHEGSHMLQGHLGPPLPDILSLVTPHLNPKLVQSLLCRSVFNAEEEAEAEVLATLIEERLEQTSLREIQSAKGESARGIPEFFLRNK